METVKYFASRSFYVHTHRAPVPPMSGYDGTKAPGTLLCQYVRTGAPVAAHSRRFARPLNKIQWQIRGAVRDGNLVVNIQSNKGYPVFSRSVHSPLSGSNPKKSPD